MKKLAVLIGLVLMGLLGSPVDAVDLITTGIPETNYSIVEYGDLLLIVHNDTLKSLRAIDFPTRW